MAQFSQHPLRKECNHSRTGPDLGLTSSLSLLQGGLTFTGRDMLNTQSQLHAHTLRHEDAAEYMCKHKRMC